MPRSFPGLNQKRTRCPHIVVLYGDLYSYISKMNIITKKNKAFPTKTAAVMAITTAAFTRPNVADNMTPASCSAREITMAHVKNKKRPTIRSTLNILFLPFRVSKQIRFYEPILRQERIGGTTNRRSSSLLMYNMLCSYNFINFY